MIATHKSQGRFNICSNLFIIDCPENHVAFGGHCYFPSFLDAPKNVKLQTWDDAKEYCRKLSSNELIYDLISIQSEEEHVFMIENNWSDVYVEFKASFMIWIGLNDVEWEGHWKWSDGQNLICTRWALEEPNNYLVRNEIVNQRLYTYQFTRNSYQSIRHFMAFIISVSG